MKKIITLSIVLFAAIMSGCATHTASQYVNPYAGVVTSNLKADVAVGGKISGTASATIVFNLFAIGAPTKFADGVAYGDSANAGSGGLALLPNPVSNIKSAAAYNAVTSASADVIVAPKYIIDVKNYFIFKKITVTVSGYKGTLRSIR